ncbi:hypothetical protein D3C72_1766130 [compost metagenome]
MFGRERQHVFGAVDGVGGAGHQGRADRQRNLARLDLVAQPFDGFGRGADPGQAGVDHRAGERGAFRQKAVARVHGVRATAARYGQEFVDIQIGIRRTIAVQAIGLVGHARVQRVEIGVRIDGYGFHAVVGAGTDDADGDFATVGNQDFLHGRRVHVMSG